MIYESLSRRIEWFRIVFFAGLVFLSSASTALGGPDFIYHRFSIGTVLAVSIPEFGDAKIAFFPGPDSPAALTVDLPLTHFVGNEGSEKRFKLPLRGGRLASSLNEIVGRLERPLSSVAFVSLKSESTLMFRANGTVARMPGIFHNAVKKRQVVQMRRVQLPQGLKNIEVFLFLLADGNMLLVGVDDDLKKSAGTVIPGNLVQAVSNSVTIGGTHVDGKIFVELQNSKGGKNSFVVDLKEGESVPRDLRRLVNSPETPLQTRRNPTRPVPELAEKSVDSPSGDVSRSEFVKRSQRVNPDFPYPEDFGAHYRTIEDRVPHLRGSVFGQYRILEGITDSWHERAIVGRISRGNRSVGDLLFIPGIPGTGKDTTVEAVVDSFYGRKGAYLDHMFSIPRINSKSDLPQLTGSPPSYIGSEQLPALLEFIVQHSGGKYYIEWQQNPTKGEVPWIIKRNHQWKPGEVLPGYFSPEGAVLFVNELHDWGAEGVQLFLKEFLEKGRVNISNVGTGGLSYLEWEGDTWLASNHFTDLYSSMDPAKGRSGKRWTYKQMKESYDYWANHPELLIERLAQCRAKDGAILFSPEVLSRIDPSRIWLTAPLDVEDLEKIVRAKLDVFLAHLQVRDERLGKKSVFGRVTWSYTDRVAKYVQQYQYEPEEMGRVIDYRIRSLVIQGIVSAARTQVLQKQDHPRSVIIDVEQDAEGVGHLIFREKTPSEERNLGRVAMRQSQRDKPKPPLTADEVGNLARTGERMAKTIFGLDSVLEQISAAAVSLANRARSPKGAKAQVLMFVGLSGTGKTALGEKIGEELGRGSFTNIAFGRIRSEQDLVRMVLGAPGMRSKIAEGLDKGQKVFILDEILNVPNPEETLKAFYDLVDKDEVVFGDSDVPRKMKGVVFVATGNPDLSAYESLPKSLPRLTKHYAYQTVHEHMMNNEAMRRDAITKSVPAPLLNRFGWNNVVYFAPHSFRSLRQVLLLGLEQRFQHMASGENSLNVRLRFASREDAEKVLNAIEEEGYVVEEQARSLQNYLVPIFEKIELALMRTPGLAAGSDIQIRFDRQKVVKGRFSKEIYTELSLVLPDGRVLPVRTPGRNVESELKTFPDELALVAFHEAAHELARNALLGEYSTSTFLSIVPGVAYIGYGWLYYAGVAMWEAHFHQTMTPDVLLRRLAGLLIGGVAEELASREGIPSSGQSNDIERATAIAENAVIRWGFSKLWGVSAAPSTITNEEFKRGLSNSRRELMESEVQRILSEARELAAQVARANWSGYLVPLARTLYRKQRMESGEISRFNRAHRVVTKEIAVTGQVQFQSEFKRAREQGIAALAEPPGKPEAQRAVWVDMQAPAIDIDKTLRKQRAKELASLEIPSLLFTPSQTGVGVCSGLAL